MYIPKKKTWDKVKSKIISEYRGEIACNVDMNKQVKYILIQLFRICYVLDRKTSNYFVSEFQ